MRGASMGDSDTGGRRRERTSPRAQLLILRPRSRFWTRLSRLVGQSDHSPILGAIIGPESARASDHSAIALESQRASAHRAPADIRAPAEIRAPAWSAPTVALERATTARVGPTLNRTNHHSRAGYPSHDEK